MPLKVLYGGKSSSGVFEVRAGDTVWFSGESCRSSWAKLVFELENQKVILVPLADILFVDRLNA
jgi:hypothetical protein